MREEEWRAIAPRFIDRPELCQELHTIIAEMSLPCRHRFLVHLGNRHDAFPARRPTRQVLAAIASTYAESHHIGEQRRSHAMRVQRPRSTLR